MLNKKVVLLDNYDSFTYNLYQYLLELGAEVLVYKNDEIGIEELKKMDFSHLVISPGPGDPTNSSDFGVCADAILEFYKSKPVLGVCLGHQGIAALFGAKIVHAPKVFHGMRCKLKHFNNCGLFDGIPVEFEVMRYHSLLVEKNSFSKELVITAETLEDSLIMAFKHKKYPLFGVQFHPESIGTLFGKRILENFLKIEQ